MTDNTPHDRLRPLALLSLAPGLLALAACSASDATGGMDAGAATITEAEIAEHLAILASDEFGGRAPSSPGEELTVNYLAEQMEAAGLEPAAGGSWFQNVPLVDITADPDAAIPPFAEEIEPFAEQVRKCALRRWKKLVAGPGALFDEKGADFARGIAKKLG